MYKLHLVSFSFRSFALTMLALMYKLHLVSFFFRSFALTMLAINV
jgi:hypothetical protein